MKTALVISLIIVSAFIVFGCIRNGGFNLMSDSIKHLEIDKAIALVKSDKHKKFLSDFKNAYTSEDSILVTSHYGHFEMIVSPPDTVDYTGGAEQYFLDKRTGNSKMGWHESPVPIEKGQ
jgi:hypothetical protein